MHKTVGFWRFYRMVTHVVAGVFLLLFASTSVAETVEPGKYLVNGSLPTWYTGQDAPESGSSIQYHGYNKNEAEENIPENSFYTIFGDNQKIYGDSACLTYGSWGDISDEDFERGNVGGGALCWCRLNGANDPSGLYSYKSKWVARGALNDNLPCWENCAYDCAQLTGHVLRWPDNQIKEKLFDTATVRTADCPAGSYCPAGEINVGDTDIYQCPEHSYSESGQSSCTCDLRYATSNGLGATIENPCILLTGPASCISGLEYWDIDSQSCVEKTGDDTFAFNNGEYMPPVYDASGEGWGCHRSRSAMECEDLMANSPNNSWLVYFNNNTEESFSGRSACSDISGYYKQVSDVQFDPTITYGRHCWCNTSSPFASNKWVLTGDFENGDICENECAGTCAYNFRHDEDFKKTMISTIQTSSTNCDAGYYCPGGEYSVLNTKPSHEKCPEPFDNSEQNSYNISQCFATISFESNGGSSVATQTFNYTENTTQFTLSQIPTPTKTDYGFIGWFDNTELNGSAITTQTQFTSSTTLYAKWGCPSGYTGTTNNITDPATQCYTTCDAIVGKTITGGHKYYNGDQSSCTYTTTVYTIRYVDEDGNALTTTNPTTLTYGEIGQIDLTDPEIPEDWLFNGWYTNNLIYEYNNFGNKITSLTQETINSLAGNGTTITIYGYRYPKPVFWVTTTPMAANDTFKFLTYYNNIYVDWDDGTISKVKTQNGWDFRHTYKQAGTYRIGMSSHNATILSKYQAEFPVEDDCNATGWPSINFSKCWLHNVYDDYVTPEKLAKIEGSLGKLLPAVNGILPFFPDTFCGCENLKGPIPEELFSGLHGTPHSAMFWRMFDGCVNLDGPIPQNLFSSITGDMVPGLFIKAFRNCHKLGTENGVPKYGIPENLFGDLHGSPQKCMFKETFAGCSGLVGTIPEGLFGALSGSTQANMFNGTFDGCSGLTGKIPDNLFGTLIGNPQVEMFQNTFRNCSGLGTENGAPTHNLPSGLFNNISGDIKKGMYQSTFEGCSGFKGSIPEDFFGNLTGTVQESAFDSTFKDASNLTGQIPTGLFSNVTGSAKRAFADTFNGATNIGKDENGNATTIPVDLFRNLSGNVASDMFNGTFANTEYLNTPVPTTLFSSLNGYLPNNEAGNRASSYSSGGMTNIFKDSNIPTSCDAGQYQYLTGFEVDWDGRVACEMCPEDYPDSISGDNVTMKKCFTACPEDENGAELIEGHKYWTEDEEHVGDVSSCVYQYKITYELFGGSNYSGAPTSYIKGVGTTIRGTPTRANSEFLKWCTDSALSDCYDEITIPADSVGNKKFYAKWETNAYTIKYFYNDGTAITTSNPTEWVVDVTEPFDLATPDIPDDWTFYAWFNNNTGFNVNTSAIKVTTITQDVLVSLSNGTNVVNLYAHKYPTSKFWMTTTQMNAGEKFAFYASNYYGDLYVDWGDGVIVKDPGDSNGYTQHTYNESGSYRIGLSSYNMNNYDTNDTVNADCGGNYHPTFWLGPIWNKDVWNQGTTTKLFKIEGNLSAVFPTTQSGVQPNFIGAFAYCSNLEGTIPPELFANITGQPRKSMFRMLFYDCQKLSGNIPANLFGGLNGTYTETLFSNTFGNTNLSGNIPADIIDPETGEKQSGLFGKLSGAPKICMFQSTFSNTPGLSGPIPEKLFGNISGTPADYMFASTFYNDRNLTGPLPEKLFGNIDGAPAARMFASTFWQASGIDGRIPDKFFGNLHGAPADRMFTNTFDGTNVSGPIPQNMFRNISGPAQPWMYNRTFALCSGLTGNITEGFFGNITEGPIQEYSYNRTFMGASGLTGPIPENLFGNVTGTAKRGFYETFKDATNIGKDDTTGEATPIPVDLFKRISGAVNSDNEMFGGTFENTKYLTSPVPTELFKGITGYLSDNEAGNRVSSYTAGGMTNIFNGSNIPTSCDAGQYQYLTGFEVDWDERVACEMCPTEYPDSIVGDNVTMKKCFTACPEDENGGEFVSGHKYWTEDEEHIGDTSSCLYKYSITYELNGADESLNTENPTEYTNHMEEALNILAPSEREHIGFGGWYDNPEFDGDAITEIPVGSVGNKIFYAKWTPDIFHISYELDGGTNYEDAPTEYTVESDTITFGTPTKEGYRFIHWLDENEEVITEIPTGSNGDRSLTAVWESAVYNIIYDYTNGGSGCENETYSYDSEKEIVCVPENSGYVFTGWYSEVENGDKIEVIPINSIGDITLYAQWTRKINIHFDANSGESIASNIPDDIVCVQGETCEIYWLQIEDSRDAAPSRNAYSFAGWNQFIDGSGHNFVYIVNPESVGIIEHTADLSYVFNLTQEQDITLYAQWSSDVFHISYELDGGTNYEDAPTEYTVESDTITFGTPTKDGFRFIHWLDENGEVITEIPTGSSGDRTLTAVWDYADFNIIYDYTNGGSGCENETYSYDSEKEIVCIPENTGHVFTGWYSEVTGGDKIEVIPINSTGDKTLYAQWIPRSYYIKYELDGGRNYTNAPLAYTYGTETIIDGVPTRQNFLFNGWCSDAELTDCGDTYIIPDTATGKQIVYAKWTFTCESQKWLHVGENEQDKICLNKTKPSGPSIAIQTSTDVYYLPLFDDGLTINKISNKKMYIQYNDNVYNIHDDSAN